MAASNLHMGSAFPMPSASTCDYTVRLLVSRLQREQDEDRQRLYNLQMELGVASDRVALLRSSSGQLGTSDSEYHQGEYHQGALTDSNSAEGGRAEPPLQDRDRSFLMASSSVAELESRIKMLAEQAERRSADVTELLRMQRLRREGNTSEPNTEGGEEGLPNTMSGSSSSSFGGTAGTTILRLSQLLPVCPKGHTLSLPTTPLSKADTTAWTCDGCEEDFMEGTPRPFGCRTCDYDLCVSCVFRKQMEMEMERAFRITKEPHHRGVLLQVTRDYRKALKELEADYHERLPTKYGKPNSSGLILAHETRYLENAEKLRQQYFDESCSLIVEMFRLSAARTHQQGEISPETRRSHGSDQSHNNNAVATQPSSGGEQPGTQQDTESNNGVAAARMMANNNSYEVWEHCLCGTGSYASVFKAFDHSGGGLMACKVAHVGRDNEEVIRRALVDEFNVLISLQHPNIVRVFEFQVVDAQSRIFMEWMAGGSVHSVLRQTGFRLHERMVRKIIREALQGLRHLHDNGLIHRDIKPQNMLMSGDGTVKLSDFGTCRATIQHSTSTAGISGTPAYMAPESVLGTPTPGSDVWALGITIIELATGQFPWSFLPKDQQQAVPLIFRIGSARPPNHHPPIPTHLSSMLKMLLQRCLEHDPTQRPSATELLDQAYFRYTDEELRHFVSDIESFENFGAARCKSLNQQPSIGSASGSASPMPMQNNYSACPAASCGFSMQGLQEAPTGFSTAQFSVDNRQSDSSMLPLVRGRDIPLTGADASASALIPPGAWTQ